MPILTLIQNNTEIKIAFSGTPQLKEVLEGAGYAVFSPCGGVGKCGKCAVRLCGEVSEPNEAERKCGRRLACQTVLLGDATAELIFDEKEFAHIESETAVSTKSVMEGYGAAVDIGTTTVALKVFDKKGECVGEAAALNPQRSFASDVIGRLDAALKGNGEILKARITDCIYGLLRRACDSAQLDTDRIEKMVITGNTAMLYLLLGRDPTSIACAPFETEYLFGEWVDLLGRRAYLPPVMNAYVGADITCAVLATGMCDSPDTALLCDVGTNGEMALWKDGELYVTSTAAGPAFEGAEISCGCGSIPGAIDKAWIENGRVAAHTIGEKAAVGVCGSGLIDIVAAFLELEVIDRNGHADEPMTVSGVTLTQEDVRALQLAKAAVAAGIEILLKRSGTRTEDIKRFYLAGGFGSHINLRSAALIGLIPASLTKVARSVGNAALSGAASLLLDESNISRGKAIAAGSSHISLGGRADFNSAFIENMLF